MLEILNGLLILSTDKAKYFSKFHPSVVLCVSVSFALYYETNFGRLLSSTLRHVKHFPLFFICRINISLLLLVFVLIISDLVYAWTHLQI
jgi:hypothetical protein